MILSMIDIYKNQELYWNFEDNKALTARKSADCTIPLKDQDTLIEQPVIITEAL